MQKSKTKPEKGRQSAPAAAPPSLFRRLRPYLLGLTAAFAIALVVYAPALRGPFVLDDHYLPFTFQEFADAPLQHWIAGVRPLLMFSFWVNHRLSAMEPFSYHLVNLLLHLFTCLFVFLIVRKLLDRAGQTGGARDGLAAFAAGLFLLHPIQTESVAYVASRSEVLSVFFFYAAFALFLYRRRESISWLESAGVLVLFGAAVTTKEHTAVLAALLLLTDYYWNPGFSFRGIWNNWRLYGMIAIGSAVAIRMVWRVLRGASTAGFALRDFTWYQYFYTQCRAIWLYVRMSVLPFGQNIDHDFRPSYRITDHGAIVGLVALVLLVGAAVYYRKRFPLASYGVLMFLLLLAPTSSIVPIADPVAERRVYLPFLGLLLVAVEFLRRWKAPRGTMTATLAGVVLVFAGLTYARCTIWSSSTSLWEDAVAKAPNKARPQFQLAFAYYSEGRCDAALPHYEASARSGPLDYRLLVDWAIAYDCVGNRPQALVRLRQAAAMRRTAQVYSLMGMVQLKDRRWMEALEALKTAESIDPNYDEIYGYRGAILAEQGDLDGARKEYQHALALNPANQTAQQGFAVVQQRLGAAGR